MDWKWEELGRDDFFKMLRSGSLFSDEGKEGQGEKSAKKIIGLRKFTVAELVAEALEKTGAVECLKKAIVEYYEIMKGMAGELQAAEDALRAAEERLQIADNRHEADQADKDRFVKIIQIRDEELASVSRLLATSNADLAGAGIEFEDVKKERDDARRGCENLRLLSEKQAKELVEAREKLSCILKELQKADDVAYKILVIANAGLAGKETKADSRGRLRSIAELLADFKSNRAERTEKPSEKVKKPATVKDHRKEHAVP